MPDKSPDWMVPDRGIRDQAIDYARKHNLRLKASGIPIEPELLDTAPLLEAIEAHRAEAANTSDAVPLSNVPVAHRATKAAAKAHMLNGGTILVSEHGFDEAIPVTPSTVTHQGGLSEWDELESMVRMWANRYPDQRYYIVETSNHDV